MSDSKSLIINNFLNLWKKTLGIGIDDPAALRQFLADNCDAIVDRSYMKPYTPEQLQGHKEDLANTSVEIEEIEAEMKASAAHYKALLKPLKEQRAIMVSNIKAKSQLVYEKCFRFTDPDDKMTGFYNAEGILIEARPATADELQPTIFNAMRNGKVPPLTGTDN